MEIKQITKCRIISHDDPELNILVDVPEPIVEPYDYGSEYSARLTAACRVHGYRFKCYTTSSVENIDYDLYVIPYVKDYT